MSHYHCIVWIDHREAHVIQFNPDDAEASVVHPKSKHEHLHYKHGAVGPGGVRKITPTTSLSPMPSRMPAKS